MWWWEWEEGGTDGGTDGLMDGLTTGRTVWNKVCWGTTVCTGVLEWGITVPKRGIPPAWLLGRTPTIITWGNGWNITEGWAWGGRPSTDWHDDVFGNWVFGMFWGDNTDWYMRPAWTWLPPIAIIACWSDWLVYDMWVEFGSCVECVDCVDCGGGGGGGGGGGISGALEETGWPL